MFSTILSFLKNSYEILKNLLKSRFPSVFLLFLQSEILNKYLYKLKKYHVSPALLLPPLIVIPAIAFKVPAIPSITLGVIAGAVLALIFQGDLAILNPDTMEVDHIGVAFGDILVCARNGFLIKSEFDAINGLLNNGGLMNMASSILMTVIAMMFGGIMEGTRQLETIVNKRLKFIKSAPAMVGATELTCILSKAIMPGQYISIPVPDRMLAPAYKTVRYPS